MPKNDNNNLLEPVAAVENYLDNLLCEAPPAETGPRPVALQEKVVRLRPLEELLAEPPPPAPEPLRETVEARAPEQPAETVVEPAPTAPEPTETVDRALIEESMALPETQPGPRPETPTLDEDPRQRYRFPVQCLMFEVADHALCIPLIDMGSVAPLDPDAMTRIPDSPDWLLGVLPHRECNLRIVDSAVLLGIQRRQVAAEGLHFLVFAEEDFAITCERLGEVVYLEDEDVRWLEGSSGLSMGTVRESLATLLSPLKIRRHMQVISAPAA